MSERDPIRDLMMLQDRMNRLFEDATQRRVQGVIDDGELERADWFPTADVLENEAEYRILLDLPGIDRRALEISVDDSRLLIKGHRVLHGEPRRSERPQGKFLRTFGLPRLIDQSKIEAEYKDGVLSVRLPKLRQEQTRRVEIKIS